MAALDDDWTAIDLGAIGKVACPPGWRFEGPTANGQGVAVNAPDGKARLVVHAVIHDASESGTDFRSRMLSAATKAVKHLREKPGVDAPEVNSISGAAQPIMEIAAVFYDKEDAPKIRIRQWHALTPMDAAAARIGVIAFSFMTPALHPAVASEEIARRFRAGLQAAAAALVDAAVSSQSP